jgi:D123
MSDFQTRASNVDACRFNVWFAKFERNTFKSEVVELDQAFIDYLLEDGVAIDRSAFPATVDNDDTKWLCTSSDDDNKDDSESESDSDVAVASSSGCADRLLKTNEAIDRALERFRGQLFVKFTWSAPIDATWMTTSGSVRCTCANEVYLLLKASDRVMHDLKFAYDQCADACSSARPHVLALRQWYRLSPGMQFRMFVRDGALVAISQRELDVYFDFLASMVDELRPLLGEWLSAERVVERHGQQCFALDVYVDGKRRVWIVDFNPWSATTAPGLYTWTELRRMPAPSGLSGIDMRVLEHRAQIRPAVGLENHLPADLFDVSNRDAIEAFAARQASQS